LKARATILVSGMIAADPWQGGATWAVLQYVLGLRELGHLVCLLEPIAPKALRPESGAMEDSDNARYFNRVMRQFELQEHAALLLSGTRETIGLSYDRLEEIAQRADVLINISGMLRDQDLVQAIPIRVYLDLDPTFNQLWQAVEGIDMRFAGHTHFATVGQNIGHPECVVPTGGKQWVPVLQPVVLERWPVADSIRHNALTTIANWRGYGSICHGGVIYGQKAHSLRPLFGLPKSTPEQFLLALAIHPNETADLTALKNNGWILLDPAAVASTPESYQQFIQDSKGELGIAKSGYVLSNCGWFSDRSVCYLASGRPVIAQETGFSRYLPTGEGLFAFRSQGDVLQAIDAVNSDYSKQCRKARDIAQEYFASDKVLKQLLRKLGL
jgi:hypothetical protein